MTNRTMTADQLALNIILDRASCPDCGHRGPHENNGDRREPMLCCVECGAHFDAPTTVQVAL